LEERGTVLDLIEKGLDNPLTISLYPKAIEWLLSLREKINKQIQEQIG
jgi:hypothetical protein